VIKYEIENFKDTEVVLDIAESPEQVRSEIVGHTGRPVEWTIGGSSTLKDIDPEESSADRMLFHVTLPPRGDDQKAQKITHTLHLVIRNEW